MWSSLGRIGRVCSADEPKKGRSQDENFAPEPRVEQGPLETGDAGNIRTQDELGRFLK